jgi:hypothetical protein
MPDTKILMFSGASVSLLVIAVFIISKDLESINIFILIISPPFYDYIIFTLGGYIKIEKCDNINIIIIRGGI